MLVMRPYQQDAIDDVYANWATGKRFVVLVMPTGSGKASVLCEIARLEAERGQRVLITAHRSELISQLSATLARNGLRHRIIAATSTIKYSIRLHMEEHGRDFYDPNGNITVASVQSVKDKHITEMAAFRDRLTIIGDEFHHYTRDSKTWGGVFTPLDKSGARGLGLTATPCRADGKGLSRETDGYGDALVVGPSMRELINMGYLVDYKIFCPPSDLHLENVKVSATTGDYADKELKTEMGKSHIVGDVVQHWLRLTPGKRGVTFTVGVDMAEEVAEAYRAAGVPAVAVSGRMSDAERIQALRDISSGKILQIVNDSVLTEGTDVAPLEVVTFARPTQSYALYCQMFGRGTRLSPATGKTHLTVIDAVSNVVRHGLPDASREWSLDRREKRSSSSDAPTLRICHGCSQPFERFLVTCPYCGEPIPTPGTSERRYIEQVDGDLIEIDPATLAQMRAAFDKVNMPAAEHHNYLLNQGVPQIGIMANVKRHLARQEIAAELRDVLAWWAGHRRAEGLQDREIYRKFYLKYGTDFLTAQTGKIDEMTALMQRVKGDM
ncbi:putative helicase [Edwardsiella phage PEi21]|uniref:Putative helicase n=1 Tax=Edwardsiella phage PEi21 TaxID=1325372 RepID=N0DPA1_9CAUD|nr:putative helicase [Edwardsiella phage PEi21]BAN16871.1 putative helicase [Edwardsiella phage PEi21]